MKLIIDIPEEAYKVLKEQGVDWLGAEHILNAVSNGIPYEERPQGEWVVKGQDIYCSICNQESAYNEFGASKFSNFCPNCGSPMQKGGAE